MTDNDVTVRYVAKANFRDLIRQAIEAKAAVKALNEESERSNKISVGSAAASASARRSATVAANDDINSSTAAAGAARFEAAAKTLLTKTTVQHTTAQNRSAAAAREAAKASESLARGTDRAAVATERGTRSLGRWAAEAARARKSGDDAGRGLDSLIRGMARLANIRPKLTPPFIALIPIFGSLLAFLTPLTAAFGAIGSAVLGLSGSLLSLGGAAVGIVPALSAALGVALALKTALGGVGGAIKAGVTAASATSTGTGKTGSTTSKADKAQVQDPFGLTSTEKVTRAQEAYRRSLQDVHFAEQDLSTARKNYQRQIDDLTDSINEYTNATKAANAADVEMSQQNYDDILADSSSTRAEKDAALAAIGQAKQKQADDAEQNAKDVADRAALRSTGVNGDRGVIESKRGVTDAKNSRRDAQLALKNAKFDAAHPIKDTDAAAVAATPAAKAADEFGTAMAKLSPAAQQFVRWVLSMRGAWQDLQRTVQQAFFSKFVADLDRLRGLLPPVQSALVAIAGALGTITDNVIKQVTSDDWKSDISTFGAEIAPVLVTVGKGLQSLLDAFKDLTMAAEPFLKKVVGAFAEGSKHFAAFIKTGRESGSIEKFLDRVGSRLDTWWNITKNVVRTLYNYGVAAAPFADWLTDGLLKMTGTWADNSEKAKKQNSDFKTYLENLKPLLKEIKGFVGDVFGGLKAAMTDPENLKEAKKIFHSIRVDVLPAVGGLLDTLGKSGIGDEVVKAIGSLAKLADQIAKNGGAQALKNFWGVVDVFFGTLLAFSKTDIGKWLSNTLLPPLGILAGLVFVGKYSGILSLLSALRTTAMTPGMAPLLAVLATQAAAKKADSEAAKQIEKNPGKATKKDAKGSADRVRSGVGTFGSGSSGGTIDPAAAGENPFDDDGKGWKEVTKGWDGFWSDFSGWMADGHKKWVNWQIDLSATIAKWARTLAGNVARNAGNIWRGIRNATGWLADRWNEFRKWASSLPSRVGKAAGNIWARVKNLIDWLSDRWSEFSAWLGALDTRVARAAGDVWHGVVGIGGFLTHQWSTFSSWLSGLPAKVGKALGSLWSKIPSLASWVGRQVANIGSIVSNALGGDGGKGKKSKGGFTGGGGSFGDGGSSAPGGGGGARWAGTIKQALSMAGAPAGWLRDIETVIDHESGGNPSAINRWDSNAKAGHPSQGLMQTIPGTFNAYAGKLRGRGITDPLANIYAGINYIRSRYGSPENLAGIKSVAHHGGWIGYAAGGLVAGHGDGDTVSAKLTPGEFVIPKALVGRIGVENLEALRSGAESFASIMGGLTGPPKMSAYTSGMPSVRPVKAPMAAQQNSMTYNIVNNYPKPERASDSLPRTIRKISYLHKGK